ncbi:DUF1259 domain-containing protein [Aneurinibacillus uraniidurans]|uniref:DUF1259 domain-containing protein n=1 Tax=Aneurinibacillus uraniidurans TaxID=2966586 RepID=UPI00234ADB1F|nr:DUF1259 domain-containing protein [Aneurinibacillus sp. B1]WCN36235.1 DUF1259 domain-containing protein [Aneurinibacillus sp. B1]
MEITREVNPVARALRENGIEVTALHNYMLNEEPRLFYMHFWANGDAVKLATGLRTALNKTNSLQRTKDLLIRNQQFPKSLPVIVLHATTDRLFVVLNTLLYFPSQYE